MLSVSVLPLWLLIVNFSWVPALIPSPHWVAPLPAWAHEATPFAMVQPCEVSRALGKKKFVNRKKVKIIKRSILKYSLFTIHECFFLLNILLYFLIYVPYI